MIDDFAKPQQFEELIRRRAMDLAARSDRPQGAKGISLSPLHRTIDAAGYHYSTVDVQVDNKTRTAALSVYAPEEDAPGAIEEILSLGERWWPLTMARELDDAILLLRTNDLDVGTWILKTRGDARRVLAFDETLAAHASQWFVRETVGMLRRTLARLEVSARSLFAIIDEDSSFAGTLFELALAADRSYMLADGDGASAPRVTLSPMNFGPYETVGCSSRIAARFYGEEQPLARAHESVGRALRAQEALELGLVTMAPDALDWNDEIRLAIEERTSLSPDALTGMEASLRFGGSETMETRIFGRLSAWQNWIFIRPNAVGESGALKVFGTGNKARFNWQRV